MSNELATMKRLNFRLGRYLPVIYQSEQAECGITCLTMIANYYGYQVDLPFLRMKSSISLKGLTLENLIQVANDISFVSRPVRLELEELRELKKPCILHWDFNHFVVLKKVRRNYIIVHDPAHGIVKYSMEEVSKHFTGVALELYPSPTFKKDKKRLRLKLKDVWKSTVGLIPALTQIIILSLALAIFALLNPLFIQFAIDNVVVAKDINLLYVLAVGFLLLQFINMGVSYARDWMSVYFSTFVSVQFSVRLLKHLMRLPASFFEKRHLGDIISRFESMTTIQQKITGDLITAIVDGFMVVLTLIIMLVYSRILTMIVVVALILYFSLRLYLYGIIRNLTRKQLVIEAKESTAFIENMRGIIPIKVFGKENSRMEYWLDYMIESTNVGVKLSKLTIIYETVNKFLTGIEHVLIITIGILSVIKNDFSVGMLMAYLGYSRQFSTKVKTFIDTLLEYRLIGVHLQRVSDIALSQTDKIEDQSSQPLTVEPPIKCDKLSFRYSKHEDYIFKDVDLKISAGEMVAITGPSGCGKTTLLKVMMRLLPASSGSVYYGKNDVTAIPSHKFSQDVVAVMQEDILLSGTILENIAFFDDNINFERVQQCAILAAVHQTILDMPMGYESLVGDMGSTLSGGQKQRILIARALYRQPKVLFLDEATSFLDEKNETIVNENLKKLNITCVMSAHRKETINMADKIIPFNELTTK